MAKITRSAVAALLLLSSIQAPAWAAVGRAAAAAPISQASISGAAGAAFSRAPQLSLSPVNASLTLPAAMPSLTSAGASVSPSAGVSQAAVSQAAQSLTPAAAKAAPSAASKASAGISAAPSLKAASAEAQPSAKNGEARTAQASLRGHGEAVAKAAAVSPASLPGLNRSFFDAGPRIQASASAVAAAGDISPRGNDLMASADFSNAPRYAAVPELKDRALTGHNGHKVLDQVRQAAVAALTKALPAAAAGVDPRTLLGDAKTAAKRIANWVLGAQSFSPTAFSDWPGITAEKLQALAKINEELVKDGLDRAALGDIQILEDAEAFPQAILQDAGLPDLRQVGAFIDDGKIRITADLARAATPEQLAAIVVHEHLALLGYNHSEGMARMQKLSARAFGTAVIDFDLQKLVDRAARGPVERPRYNLGRNKPVEPEVAVVPRFSDSPRLAAFFEHNREMTMVVPSLILLAALPGMFMLMAHRLGQSPWSGIAPFVVGALALGVVWQFARSLWLYFVGHRREFREALESPVVLGDASLPFDAVNLTAERYQEGGGYRFVQFHDQRGWEVVLILRDGDSVIAPATLEWGYRDFKTHAGQAAIQSVEAWAENGETRSIPPALFRGALQDFVVQAITKRMQSSDTPVAERAKLNAFINELKRKALD